MNLKPTRLPLLQQQCGRHRARRRLGVGAALGGDGAYSTHPRQASLPCAHTRKYSTQVLAWGCVTRRALPATLAGARPEAAARPPKKQKKQGASMLSSILSLSSVPYR